MDLREYRNATEFLAATGDRLALREAEHNLLLGIAAAVARETVPPRAFFAAAFDDWGDLLLAMLLTEPHRLILSQPARTDAATLDALAARIVAALAGAWRPGGVLGPVALADRVAAEWQRVTGQGSRRGTPEWIYRVDRVRPPDGVPGGLRPIAPGDRERLIEWSRAFEREALHEESPRGVHARHVAGRLAAEPPSAFVWDDGGPRSMAMATGPTPRGIRVNWVFTPLEWRGRGYARACVAALSARLLAEGRDMVFLFADAGNATSNFVYRSIGYERVAEVREIDFVDGQAGADPPPATEG